MLTDEHRFDCRTCMAAPQLQKVLGCFKSLETPIAILDGQPYRRCPVAYRVEGAQRIVDMVTGGAALATFETKMKWPPKRLAAILYTKYLMDLRASERNEH